MKQEAFKNNLDELVQTTIRVLKQGGLVVVPSDTVYGLSVDATNKAAVEKLIAFKSRPAGKPISVFVHSLQTAGKYVHIDVKQEKILQSILPGRFTVVLPSKHILDNRLESEKGALGIRVIDHSFVTELTKKYPDPITATSANLSGTSPHYSIESLLKTLSTKKRAMIDYIIDYGKLPYNKPSTVIDLTGDEVAVLRKGDISLPEKKRRHPERVEGSTFISHNERQTKQIAKNFIKQWEKDIAKKALVIILQGELGAGKTQFVKGIGEYLGLKDIISPTFVIYYEYKIPKKSFNNLYHVDLYNVSEKSEFKHLGFEEMLKPGNIICIEWGEKSGEITDLLRNEAYYFIVQINYKNEKERLIKIVENQS